MARPIVVFEDEGYANLLPLVHTRPACRLRCGIVTLLEKIRAAYPSAPIVVHTRDWIAPVVAEEVSGVGVNELSSEAALLVNGRAIVPADLAQAIPLDGDDCVYVSGGQIVAARISGARCAEVAGLIAGGPLREGWAAGSTLREVDVPVVRYPWDLVSRNAEQIAGDFAFMKVGGKILGRVHGSAVLEVREKIHVGEGAEIRPGAILTARDGPIYIGPGARVMAGAVVEGPVAVGRDSTIKILAKIYAGTSLGAHCKVGGEVAASIFQGHSNKQHDGFLGHAYLGEWINLGADTNNSDLKNNYSSVTVIVNGRKVDSGSLFVGLMMGDHSKTGINTMFNTGTVVGVGCNIYGADFPPKCVPSFCWGGANGFVEYDLAKCLATAATVMGRRGRDLTPAGRATLETVFRLTAGQREALINH